MTPTETRGYLSRSPESFREAFQRVQEVVLRAFPDAESVFQYGMPGWAIPLANPPIGIKGTIDPTHISIFLANRKLGPSLHVWHPADYSCVEKHRPELSQAGFRVMRACLEFNRKRPYPIEAVEKLLTGMQR